MKRIMKKIMKKIMKRLITPLIKNSVKQLTTLIRQYKKRSKNTRLIIAVLVIGSFLYFSNALIGWFMSTEEIANTPIPVETVQAKQQNMQQSLQTLGILSGVQEVKLKAACVGRVQQFLATPGAWVETGALLIHIAGGPDIRAPFAGYITDYQVKIGEFVASGTELIDLVNTKKMLLTYRVPELYSNQLKIGQTVDLKVLAFKDKTFQAKVSYISPMIDKKTFTVLVRAELDNPNQDLKPGMSAHISHVLSENLNALVIPEACLMPTLEGYDVLLIREGKLQRQAVTIGGRKSGRAEILSGLTLGESVVMTQNFATQEGAPAKACDWTGEW